jgi:hypothetical protein
MNLALRSSTPAYQPSMATDVGGRTADNNHAGWSSARTAVTAVVAAARAADDAGPSSQDQSCAGSWTTKLLLV